MHRRRATARPVIAAVSAVVALVASLLVGAAPASADHQRLDWYFRAPNGGPTTTFGNIPSGSSLTWLFSCDVDGRGDRPATYANGRFTFFTDGGQVRTTFGRAGSDRPFCGDWDGDGRDTPAVRRAGTSYLASSLADGGGAVTAVGLGRASDDLHTGDWDGDGVDTFLVQRGTTFIASSDNVPGGGRLTSSTFGRPGDWASAGRFASADGPDTIALTRGATWYVSHDPVGSRAVLRSRPAVSFGRCTDLPFAGSPVPSQPAQLGVIRLTPTDVPCRR